MEIYTIESELLNVCHVKESLTESFPDHIQSVVRMGDKLKLICDTVLESETLAEIVTYLNTLEDVEAENSQPKIYRYAKSEAKKKHFHNINYTTVDLTQNLIPKRTVIQGEVVRVEWFSTMDGLTPTDLIIVVDIKYTRSDGFVVYRSTTRTWINEDESANEDVKTTMKYYTVNSADTIREGIKRRSLLIEYMQSPLLELIKEVLIPKGYTEEVILLKTRGFLDEYRSEFDKFIENSSTIIDPSSSDYGLKTVVSVLMAEDRIDYTEWLNLAPASLGGATTLRQYIISELSI